MSEDDIEKLSEAFSKSVDNREVDITMFGNKYTIVQIVTLLSYIRNAIKSNTNTTINVTIGSNVRDRDFEFLVNNQIADNMIVKEKIDIN